MTGALGHLALGDSRFGSIREVTRSGSRPDEGSAKTAGLNALCPSDRLEPSVEPLYVTDIETASWPHQRPPRYLPGHRALVDARMIHSAII